MKLSFSSIELHNFKGVSGLLHWKFHGEPGFYFVQGTNKKEPRLGANGAGKSTIFTEAPYWVLTGKTILSQRPGALVENWENKKNVTGRLHLKLDGMRYTIERGRNPSVLMINGRAVQQPEIDELLPLSDAALRRTILLGQRSQMFLDLRPEDKSKLFTETLDLDKWLIASDRAGDQIRLEDRKLTNLRQAIALLTGAINQIRDQHEKAAEQETLFTENKKAKIVELRKQIKAQDSVLENLNNILLDNRQALNSVKDDDTSKLETLRSTERAERRKLGSLEANLGITRREEQKIRERIEEYQESKTCPECGQEISIEHAEDRLTELQADLIRFTEQGDTTNKQIMELDHQLAKLALDINKLENRQKVFLEIKQEVAVHETTLASEQRTHDRLVRDLEIARAEVNQFTALCNELEQKYDSENAKLKQQKEEENRIVHGIEILRFWQKGFRDIRLELIDTTLLELELATNRNAQALGLEDWRIKFTTERETKSGSVSQAFTVLLYPPGQDEPIDWAAFSGGEAQRWHIAVTCGLSEVLLGRAGIDPDTEIYDEVTSYISSEGIENVLDFLRNRAFDLDRKIYLIDHHVGVGDFTDTVHVIKDSTGIHID